MLHYSPMPPKGPSVFSFVPGLLGFHSDGVMNCIKAKPVLLLLKNVHFVLLLRAMSFFHHFPFFCEAVNLLDLETSLHGTPFTRRRILKCEWCKKTKTYRSTFLRTDVYFFVFGAKWQRMLETGKDLWSLSCLTPLIRQVPNNHALYFCMFFSDSLYWNGKHTDMYITAAEDLAKKNKTI